MYTYNAHLQRVIDGDTVDVVIDLGFSLKYKCRVRLLGINAPESRTRDLEEKARGLAAKKRLGELIGDGDLIVRTFLDKKGKYGRLLAEIFRAEEFGPPPDNKCVNTIMLEEGHAVPYPS